MVRTSGDRLFKKVASCLLVHAVNRTQNGVGFKQFPFCFGAVETGFNTAVVKTY